MLVEDFKVFVPARDFEISKAYYLDLGCRLNWEDEGRLAELELGPTRFLLQNHYVPPWAENFMIHLRVDDVEAWYTHVKTLVDSGKYEGIRVNPPKDEPWGDRISYAWDPSGILLHFAQKTPT